MCRMVVVGGREGKAWWLPARGIRASQGFFSSFFILLKTLIVGTH